MLCSVVIRSHYQEYARYEHFEKSLSWNILSSSKGVSQNTYQDVFLAFPISLETAWQLHRTSETAGTGANNAGPRRAPLVPHGPRVIRHLRSSCEQKQVSPTTKTSPTRRGTGASDEYQWCVNVHTALDWCLNDWVCVVMF